MVSWERSIATSGQECFTDYCACAASRRTTPICFVGPDQIETEVSRVLDFTFFILRTFGFNEFEVYLSTRPKKSVGAESTGRSRQAHWKRR